MGNSGLISGTKKSPNHSGKRTKKIDRITPHCVVGDLSAQSVCEMFAKKERMASSNYVIGKKGEIFLCVDEEKRSWCSSSEKNDQRAVTIECASEKTAPYAFSEDVYKSLIDLCVDVCERNKKKKLIWIDEKEKALSYKQKNNEMLLTCHRWFKSTACPGEWMMEHMGELAEKVTKELEKGQEKKLYKVQVGAFSKKENAEKMLKKIKEAGFDAFIKEE